MLDQSRFAGGENPVRGHIDRGARNLIGQRQHVQEPRLIYVVQFNNMPSRTHQCETVANVHDSSERGGLNDYPHIFVWKNWIWRSTDCSDGMRHNDSDKSDQEAYFHVFCLRTSFQWYSSRRYTPIYLTSSSTLPEWLLNSGAYMHWTCAMPLWYVPRCCTRTEYSKTYVPFGR